MVVAWASPAANQSLQFPASGCRVQEAHTVIHCTSGPAVGASLTWRVLVEGQANAVPLSSIAPPTVHAAVFLQPQEARARTTGGTLVVVSGSNFGVSMEFVAVALSSSSGVTSVPDCNMTQVDAELVCVLPAGTGPIFWVSVTVLGQGASLLTPWLAYARPVVASVSPPSWPTDLTALSVSVAGSGFGSPALTPQVQVDVSGVVDCRDGPRVVALPVASVTVRSDKELTFEVRGPGLLHVAAGWAVSVTVSGQSVEASVSVPTLAPALAAVVFDTAPNATHFFLALTGSNFGPLVAGACPGNLRVAVNGQPCGQLTMTLVRWCMPTAWESLRSLGKLTLGSIPGTAQADPACVCGLVDPVGSIAV